MTYIVITVATFTGKFLDNRTGIVDPFADERGLIDRVEFDPTAIPDGFPLFPPAPDLIYIRPDWPPIGSPDFAEKLREWHAQHNPCRADESLTLNSDG